ncbi:response regulator [Candidatus Pyrohabitans sp.]
MEKAGGQEITGRILVVDDEKEIQNLLRKLLSKEGYEADVATLPEEALNKIDSENYDVVLLDLMLPGVKGTDIIQEIKRRRPHCAVIIMTAFGTIPSSVEAIKKGAFDYIEKPFKKGEIQHVVRNAMEHQRLNKMFGKRASEVLKSVANPLRRDILEILVEKKSVKLMEIVKLLGVKDHTKVSFHLRKLKEQELVVQNGTRAYRITPKGVKVLETIWNLEREFL